MDIKTSMGEKGEIKGSKNNQQNKKAPGCLIPSNLILLKI